MNNAPLERNRFVAYYRKSTESDERQVQSIPDQRNWAEKVATEQGLIIPFQYEESRSARKPGRPIFQHVLDHIEAGEADSLLVYDPSRIARNALDGARIIELLDTGKLKFIITSTSNFRSTSTDKFMLAFFFAQSKHYVDNLREVTLRGMISKANKGMYPGRAKLGYLNDLRTHDIVPDPVTFPLIKKAYEHYATNRFGLVALAEELCSIGFTNGAGHKLTKSQVANLLTNPFYYGAFVWGGEIYQGTHKPAVSKKLWDKAQQVHRSRSKPQGKWQYRFPFLGLLRCSECGSSITAEKHTKKQKNGNVHTWIYYRCTKKASTVKCEQPFMREELLTEELVSGLQRIAIPETWAEKMLARLDEWEFEDGSRESAQLVELGVGSQEIEAKLRRLNDLHVDGELDRADYIARKRKLVNEKIALDARRKLALQDGPYYWLEPLRKLINAVRERSLPTAGGDLLELRDFVAEVGSNLCLNSRKVLWNWSNPFSLLTERRLRKGWQPQ